MTAEDIRWKLARCRTCGAHRLMLAGSASCPTCERGSRATALSSEDARWVISFREPASFVRAAWMLASETMNAAMGLDMATGAMTVHRWDAGKETPVDETEGVIILAVCPAARKAELPGLLAVEGTLSEEDAEELAYEAVVRSALGDEGRRFWAGVEAQLQQTLGLREQS